MTVHGDRRATRPLPLQRRRADRITELERIFGTAIDLVEVYTVAGLVAAVGTSDMVAVAMDTAPPGQIADVVAAAGSLPILRPLWRRQRNTRGETDEVFDGYGRLIGTDILRLADGELSST